MCSDHAVLRYHCINCMGDVRCCCCCCCYIYILLANRSLSPNRFVGKACEWNVSFLFTSSTNTHIKARVRELMCIQRHRYIDACIAHSKSRLHVMLFFCVYSRPFKGIVCFRFNISEFGLNIV